MSRHPRPRPYWLVFLVMAIAVTGLVLWLWDAFPGALSEDDGPHLAYRIILLVVVASLLFGGTRLRAGTALRYAAWWIAIGALVVLAYSFRWELRDMGNRIMGELRPDRPMALRDGSVSVRRAGDGHFYLTATVDGTPVRFMVDTGATLVALSPDDAERLGFDLSRLRFGTPAFTANGMTMKALVSLGEVAAGPIRLRDVEAMVSRGGLGNSLLGLSFLNRLSGYEVRGDTMILKP